MNENVLAGIHCPDCGNEERFFVSATARLALIDNGIEDVGDSEWGAESPAECAECGRVGTWSDFGG